MSASLPDVRSECRGGGRYAEPEPEGGGWSTSSTTSHEERTSGWFADEVGLVFIPWNLLLYAWNWQNKYIYFCKQICLKWI